MHLQVKMLQNGRNNPFRRKQTTIKMSLMPLGITERRATTAFLDAVNKQEKNTACMYRLKNSK